MSIKVRFAVALFTLVCAEGAARAQATGFALDRFDPSERGSEWFANESLDFRGKQRPAAGLVFDGQYRPLAVYNADGSVRDEIVRNVFTMHAGASVVLFERLRLGLDIPLTLYQDGTSATFQGVTYPAPGSPSIGDLRFGADVRLYGDYDGPVRVALGARLWVPTGNRDDYDSDGITRFEPRAMVAGDYRWFTYAARFGFEIREPSGSHDFAGGKIGSEILFAAAAGVRVLDKRLVVGPELYWSTVVTESDAPFSLRSTPVELDVGAHYTLPTHAGDVRFGAGGGLGLTRGFGSPAARYLFSVEWAPSVRYDRDNDGIVDAEDACPDVAGVHTNDPKTNGCPPERPKPTPHVEPPPPPPPPPDQDGDGIPDATDACPDVPGVANDDPKRNGCPPDRDGDGIPDAEDACPDQPGIKSAVKEFNGCPADIDADGILNEQDACPTEPGKPDPDPKKNGCPKAYVQAGMIKILDQVKFKTASSDIMPGKDSEEVLQAVLKVFHDHTEIKLVRVEGHTDNRGPAEYNRKLSGARAQSVVTWLVKHGVEASRLTSEGFGFDKPIDTNDTEGGRKNNRRVEFHIVGGENKP